MITDFVIFLWASIYNLVTLLSGVVAVMAELLRRYFEWEIPNYWYVRVVFMCLMLGMFSAWREEHLKVEKKQGEIDQRAQTDTGAAAKIMELSKKLDCVVGSWSLTPDQLTTIATYLQEHKPYEITVSWISYDKRATRCAEDLSKAFREGNWRVSPDPTQEEQLRGVTVFYRSNEATQKANQNRRRSASPNPGEVMQEALRRAGLRGSDVPNYSLAPDPKLTDNEYKVMVTVGLGPYLLGCEETEDN